MNKLQRAVADAVEDIRIEFIANPTQRTFIESRHQADLFSSRKGEGKSAGLVWSAFYYTKHNPGATGLFIRDTFENLKKTTMQEFFFWFPDGVFGHYHAQDKVWTWDTARTGLKGKIYWMGADDDKAATKIASMPLAFACVDEPSPAAGDSSGVPEMVFDTIMGQLRQPGMKWYTVKLAQNNPDESHWTYKRFVDPGMPPDRVKKRMAAAGITLLPDQEPGFIAHQTREPENLNNLPPGYYENLEEMWGHRPDLVKRFIKGKYGYQQVGRPVTGEWNDDLHLARDLRPVKGSPLWLLWDGGHNPTCIITQITPIGYWLFLEAFVGDGIGAYQLIENKVAPAIASRYEGFELFHTGDPNLNTGEQSDTNQSAVKVILKTLGGKWYPGPDAIEERTMPLKSVLGRTIEGVGVIQVDKVRAKAVWFALRGGWHYHVAKSGAVGTIKKNKHSHPGDAVGYGAAKLFPLGRARKHKQTSQSYKPGSYYSRAPNANTSHPDSLLNPDRRRRVPKEARKIRGL